jgi:hypothetical protein
MYFIFNSLLIIQEISVSVLCFMKRSLVYNYCGHACHTTVLTGGHSGDHSAWSWYVAHWPRNLPVLKIQFPWNGHGEDILTPTNFSYPRKGTGCFDSDKPLANFTVKALTHTHKSIFLLNQETTQIKKVVLHNKLALDMQCAAHRGTCALTPHAVLLHNRYK